MYSRSIKMTLFVYLAFAWLASSILSSVVLLVKYPPYSQSPIEHFSIGALVLDCVLWELLFTVVGSLSLLNVYPSIQKDYFLSLCSFILLPIVALIIMLLITRTTELFGASEAGIVFLVVQVFFFLLFRNCVKRKTVLSVY